MKPSVIIIPAFLGSLGFGIAVEQQHPIGDSPSLSPPSDSPSAASKAPAYRHDLLSLHKSLVEIPSVSGTENRVGSFLIEYLTERDYVAQLQFLPPAPNTPDGAERFNVLAWPGPTRNPKPRVLVTSHIDVVPPYIPYGIDNDGKHVSADTRISGRGSVDAKASVAAQIIAVQELLAAEEIPREDVMLLFVVGEETTGDGMKYFSSKMGELDPPPAFRSVIFGEPTENKLACGHEGIAICTVSAQGKAAHSGYPWLGKSATEVLMRALVKVLDTDLGTSERFGNTTANVGTINGGVAMNVVAKNATAALSVRIAAGNQTTGMEVIKTRVEKILKEVDEEALSLECQGATAP